ncbi:nucleotide-binding universal stress UspA family protein [Winogradskyella epiphytica]|uniref:Nucleotide-binding universal stress UspA family protein n=1 Tax=Winogradskyella epiphytica TaxID=262005 RepID=A0A2V4X534_9FLAO|nr:universal stress protein [Winogradskyella epiphytica]PYE80155.1 nucleotide-binding universal stress UspA family protein [Winogradskyella epiphytica]GGW71701.1 universal stress protein UspA [Winogradskyella epiphytica]
MKQILLLTDFSKNSINAMHYALRLFENDKCQFYVLHVESTSAYISDDLVMSGGKSVYDSLVKKTKHRLLKLIDDLKSEFKNEKHSFHEVVDYDGLTTAINQVKTSKTVELIVMGSNGVTGATEAIFGSNTINVIRNVNCPTLVVPEGFAYREPKEVLLPLDVDKALNSKAFLQFLNITEPYRNKLHVLRIIEGNDASKVEDEVRGVDLLVSVNFDYHVIDDVPIEYAVSSYIQTNHIDLTALIVKKETLFERFFVSSTTKKMSNELRVPLLVLHN